MIKVRGINRLIHKMQRLSDSTLVKAYNASMAVTLLNVKNESMANTPVDTGNLRASHHTKKSKATPVGVNGEVWNSANYAVYVHEMTWTKLRSGRHKFLEYAVQSSRAKTKRNIATILRKALRRGHRESGYVKAGWKA